MKRKTPGIYRRRLKSGKVCWDARAFIKGKQVSKRFRSLKAARDWRARFVVSLNDFGVFTPLKQSTFEEYAERWMQTHLSPTEFKPATLAAYRGHIERLLIPEFGEMPMLNVNSEQINNFRASLLKRLAPASAQLVLIVLGKILRDAVRENYIRISPMAGVEKVKHKGKKTCGRALTVEEIRALLNGSNESEIIVIETAVLTGLREGELFALHWPDIDWQHDQIHVTRNLIWRYGKHHQRKPGEPKFIFDTPKSKYSIRKVDLSPELKRKLRELYLKSPDKAGLIFRGRNGRPVIPSDFYKRRFKPLLTNVGILGNLRFHDLRHTYGSLKLAQGESIFYVSRQMGHSSIRVTADVYGHILKTQNAEAAAKTDELIFGFKGGRS